MTREANPFYVSRKLLNTMILPAPALIYQVHILKKLFMTKFCRDLACRVVGASWFPAAKMQLDTSNTSDAFSMPS